MSFIPLDIYEEIFLWNENFCQPAHNSLFIYHFVLKLKVRVVYFDHLFGDFQQSLDRMFQLLLVGVFLE